MALAGGRRENRFASPPAEGSSDMSGAAEYAIGAQVHCEDGACGDLVRVVVDPVKRAVTHLVVQRRHGHDVGRLVPVDLVEAAGQQEVRLRCTRAEFEALEYAKETEFLPAPDGQWGYGPNQALLMPYFGLEGTNDIGEGQPGRLVPGGEHDRVPPGEVDVRRGQRVHASDGAIGNVRGLVVDPSDYQVTHVLLDEGHLWGKKEVSIPISAVTEVDDDVRLNLTKAEVADLPPVEVEKHGG
jgi:sporulation protein YlmC with PRC-barrel domain